MCVSMENNETRHERRADPIGSGETLGDFNLGSDMMIFTVEED